MPTRIELWSLDSFFALIVLAPTGIGWTNQAGGVCCAQPEAEGVLIPLPCTWGPRNDSLGDYSGPNDVAAVGKWLTENGLIELFEPDPDATDLMEAWIPVRIKALEEKNFHSALLGPFAGQRGILTYQNSD